MKESPRMKEVNPQQNLFHYYFDLIVVQLPVLFHHDLPRIIVQIHFAKLKHQEQLSRFHISSFQVNDVGMVNLLQDLHFWLIEGLTGG